MVRTSERMWPRSIRLSLAWSRDLSLSFSAAVQFCMWDIANTFIVYTKFCQSNWANFEVLLWLRLNCSLSPRTCSQNAPMRGSQASTL